MPEISTDFRIRVSLQMLSFLYQIYHYWLSTSFVYRSSGLLFAIHDLLLLIRYMDFVMYFLKLPFIGTILHLSGQARLTGSYFFFTESSVLCILIIDCTFLNGLCSISDISLKVFPSFLIITIASLMSYEYSYLCFISC